MNDEILNNSKKDHIISSKMIVKCEKMGKILEIFLIIFLDY